MEAQTVTSHGGTTLINGVTTAAAANGATLNGLSSSNSNHSSSGGGGGNSASDTLNNRNNGTSINPNGGNNGGNNHSSSSLSNHKTYRDYNNRHSSGQYKKYGGHHYGYGGHNNMHYQRYNNGNGHHRNAGNKHYHNSYHHNNPNSHYQGQNYHHQYGQQNRHHHHNSNNNLNGGNSNNSGNGGGHSNSQYHHQNTHHANNNSQNQQHHQTQYYNDHTGGGGSAPHHTHYNNHHHQHHNHAHHQLTSQNLGLLMPAESSYSMGKADSSSINSSISPKTIEWSSEDGTNLTCSSAASSDRGDDSGNRHHYHNSNNNLNGGNSNNSSNGGHSNSQYHHQNTHHANNSQNQQHHQTQYYNEHTGGGGSAPHLTYYNNHHHQHPNHTHHQLISQNLGLLMPADSSFSMGKADSSINSSISDKTIEWSEDGTNLTCSSAASSDRGDDSGYATVTSTYIDNRCSTPDYCYYYYTPYTITTPQPFTTTEKKRFFNGTGTGKLSQAVHSQRFHHYPRKMYHLPGFPREWFDDLDPEEYVRAFSTFGEIKERPAALSQNPQIDSLSEGIWLKFVANQQTTDTFRKKMELWRDVYRIVRSMTCNSHFKHDPRNFPTFGLQVVGSTMSGFGSNTSDVDMCLLVRGSDVDQRYEAVDKLQVLYGALSATQWLDNVELIYAKVPILKFRDSKRSLEVDLNCNNFVGIRNTHLLYCYSQADWRLKPLVLVVKLWAHYHGINDAKNMTISSYSLVLMVIHFLQCGMDEPVLPILQQRYPEKFSSTSNILNVKINEVLPSWTSKNKETIGNLLIQFLKYYGKSFDYTENAVSVRTGRTIPIKQAAAYKSLKNDPHQWKYLCIEEPFDRTNTARSVYDRDTFEKIIGIFNISYERLQASRNLESIFTPISDPDINAISSVIIR